ncbi:MAG: hydroxyacid dehydrogenase [Gammaproteobacteria bacterium]|jgi:phosphoglycerate dehydrogenase-like enzyme|nr:hydroxyacid dehydrogenase [Gammaproteobacteria bacterium]
MKVVWNYVAGPDLARRLAGLAERELAVEVCPEADDDRLFDLLADADVLWHCLRPVDRTVLEAAPRLKLVQKIGVGVNTIDLETARARDVAVCNMPGTNSRAVAEHTLALMLAVLRQVTRFDADVRAGRGWAWPAARQDRLGEIGGRTIGLVGFGAIPEVLEPVLSALGARVLYTARTPKPGAAASYRSLDDLLRESDVVSLHVPLTGETQGLLDAGRLALMKPGAVLVNTARGALVDETALLAALESGHLGGAGLDVFASEPLAPDHPLLQRQDVVLAPHVAWLTGETLDNSLSVAVENCRRLAAGEALLHRVA